MPSTLHLVSTDLRGSTRVVSDADGKAVAWFGYGPFGDSLDTQTSGDAPLAARLTRRFTGQAFDAETALYHYGARLYDDRRAGFVSADPAHRTPSPYAYCANDPVDHVDPDGKAPHWVVYFNGWFLILDEHDVVVAIFGDADSALASESTKCAIAVCLSGARINPFTTPPHVLKQQLADLAVPTKTWSAAARSRLSAVLDATLKLVKSRRVRASIQDGFGRGLRSKQEREHISLFQSQRQIMSPKTVNSPQNASQPAQSHDPFQSWKTAVQRNNEHQALVDSRRLSYFFVRRLRNPARYTVKVEYWYPIFLDDLDHPALQPDPRLYLFLRRGDLPADLDPKDRARIDAHIEAVDAQLPSNTTAVTSPTAPDVEDDGTHESQTEEESEHAVPAKPGGEKPYMPSDEDTESL